jgi:hypothetical protein
MKHLPDKTGKCFFVYARLAPDWSGLDIFDRLIHLYSINYLIMKLPTTILTLIMSISLGFSQTVLLSNNFKGGTDTLILKSTRVKGVGLFQLGAGSALIGDTVEFRSRIPYKDYPLIFPDGIKNIELGIHAISLRPLRFRSADGKDLIQEPLSVAENCFGLMYGTWDNREILIVDQNHNGDFRDDTVRSVHEFGWGRKPNSLLVCKYIVKAEGKIISDSSWIEIGTARERLLMSTYQHQVSNVAIGKYFSQLGVADENGGSFCYLRPILALLSENGIRRDTLFSRDFVSKGQYIKLGSDFYKFHDFYSGDGTIVLIKENDFAKQVGVQVGLISPDFRFKTVTGDTLTSVVFKNKKVLIVNVSGCTPSSYEIYKELNKAAEGKLTILGINSGVVKGLSGMMVDVTDSYNEFLYNQFRNAYSSYDCFLISEEGRVIDKFDVFDWKSHLTDFPSSN